MAESKASTPNPNPDIYTLPEITTFRMQPPCKGGWGIGPGCPWIEVSKVNKSIAISHLGEGVLVGLDECLEHFGRQLVCEGNLLVQDLHTGSRKVD